MILRMFALSSRHVSAETLHNWLPGAGNALPSYRRGSEGWIVEISDPLPAAVPADLAACMAFASAQGCEWLLMDPGQMELSVLPVLW